MDEIVATHPAIRAAGLARDYGTRRALGPFDLEVEAGRIVALLGTNGAGKSTLLKLLAGAIEPTAGEAHVLGLPARDLPQERPAAVASLIDGHEPPAWATATRMIAMQSEVSPKFDVGFAKKFCFGGGIESRAPYGALSKGQRRRVLAGLTLASGADVMLLDEPADGLDPAARRELYDILRRHVNESGATALVATHVINDVERVADDVAIVDRGRLLLSASIEELREQVREIELEPDRLVKSNGSIKVLGNRSIDGANIYWVRSEFGEPYIAATLEPVSIRPVGLEDLFLALTQTAPIVHSGACP